MSRARRFHASFRSRAVVLLILVPASLLCSCDDGDDIIIASEFFKLTFNLSADFQVPHGNQPIEWALVRSLDGLTLGRGDGTVSPIRNPAFTLTTGRVLEDGVDYELRYWIDSNTNGGTPGVCDSETIDHQWNWRFTAQDNDVNFTLLYNADRVEDVCDTFIP